MSSLVPSESSFISEVRFMFEDVPLGHSDYQIEQFIIKPFLTPDRQYRQCMLELHSRYNALRELEFDHQDAILDIEEAKSGIEQKRAANRVARFEFRVSQMQRKARDIVREMRTIAKIAARLKDQREFESFEEAEPQYWELKLSQKA